MSALVTRAAMGGHVRMEWRVMSVTVLQDFMELLQKCFLRKVMYS